MTTARTTTAKAAAAKAAEAEAAEAAKLAKAAKATEAAKAKTVKHLVTVAKEINARFDKVNKLTADADDHRLSAACHLAEARDECRQVGITFKKWVEDNINRSYGDAHKLLTIGAAELANPGDGAKLLEDMRAGAATRNKNMRDRKKAAASSSGPAQKAKPPVERAQEAIAAMKADERVNLIKSVASNEGLSAVSQEAGQQMEASKKLSSMDRAKDAFARLSSKEKLAFVEWVAGEGLSVAQNDSIALVWAMSRTHSPTECLMPI